MIINKNRLFYCDEESKDIQNIVSDLLKLQKDLVYGESSTYSAQDKKMLLDNIKQDYRFFSHVLKMQ